MSDTIADIVERLERLGYVVVPKETIVRMETAALAAIGEHDVSLTSPRREFVRTIYTAMLAARPLPVEV